MAHSDTITALNASDIHHLRMAAYNLASVATDQGFAELAAKLEHVPHQDAVALIHYINELWDSVCIPMMQRARTELSLNV